MYKLIIIFLALITIAGCSKTQKEVTTASGLKYTDIKEGTGVSPVKGKTVSVHYTGTFQDGKVFDSSIEKKQPLVFAIGMGEMIPGFDEGIMSMKVGGKRKLVIPPDLAWGAQGAGDVIPPNTTTYFEVELLDVK